PRFGGGPPGFRAGRNVRSHPPARRLPFRGCPRFDRERDRSEDRRRASRARPTGSHRSSARARRAARPGRGSSRRKLARPQRSLRRSAARAPQRGKRGGRSGDGADARPPAHGCGASSNRRASAAAGRPGSGRNSSGRSGADRILSVPPGTLVIDRATKETVADLTAPGEEVLVARGGSGGKGNARFATSTRRAPRIAEDGGKGE